MKKIFLMIQVAAMSAGIPAFGWVGGPFENGDAGILLERGGFYQATFTYKNGNGYSIWTADAQLDADPSLDRGSLVTPASVNTTVDHQANRTVLYYKGLTYAGGANGSLDLDRRQIQGFFNASSDLSPATAGQNFNSAGNGFFAVTSGSGAQNSTSSVVASGRSFVSNGSWEAKITETHPSMRFEGKGEIVFFGPNGADTTANLAVDGYTRLVQAISTSVASTGSNLFFDSAVYTQAASAIANILTGTQTTTFQNVAGIDANGDGDFIDADLGDVLPLRVEQETGIPPLADYLTNINPTNSFEEMEKAKLKVSGIRRFF